MAITCCDTSDAWGGWTGSTCTATTTSTTAWRCWTGGTTATTSSITGSVWMRWTASTGDTTIVLPAANYDYSPPPVLTEAEKLVQAEAARKRAEEAAERAEKERIRAEEARKQAEEAAARAEKLLLEMLDKQQRKEYAKDKSFHVVGQDGEKYKIKHGWSGHVERVVKGKSVERFCIHPRVQVPVQDNQLLAKLMLETDPVGFKKIANRTELATV